MFDTLLAKARQVWDNLTPKQQQDQILSQRNAVLIDEAGFGSDRQEREYSDALARGDSAALARLDAEAQERMMNTARVLGILPKGTRIDDPSLPTGKYFNPRGVNISTKMDGEIVNIRVAPAVHKELKERVTEERLGDAKDCIADIKAIIENPNLQFDEVCVKIRKRILEFEEKA